MSGNLMPLESMRTLWRINHDNSSVAMSVLQLSWHVYGANAVSAPVNTLRDQTGREAQETYALHVTFGWPTSDFFTLPQTLR